MLGHHFFKLNMNLKIIKDNDTIEITIAINIITKETFSSSSFGTS